MPSFLILYKYDGHVFCVVAANKRVFYIRMTDKYFVLWPRTKKGILFKCDGQVFCVVAANKKVFYIIETDKYFEYKGTMRCVLSYYFLPIVF